MAKKRRRRPPRVAGQVLNQIDHRRNFKQRQAAGLVEQNPVQGEPTPPPRKRPPRKPRGPVLTLAEQLGLNISKPPPKTGPVAPPDRREEMGPPPTPVLPERPAPVSAESTEENVRLLEPQVAADDLEKLLQG